MTESDVEQLAHYLYSKKRFAAILQGASWPAWRKLSKDSSDYKTNMKEARTLLTSPRLKD